MDRIDYSEDYFRIIDYKSGNPNFKNLKNGLFYGTKLQLFIYAQAINQNVNKNFFGAFYLPVQNKFEKNEQDSLYKYIGFILNSVPLAQKCDKNFNADTKESKYFDFKLNKPTKSGELIFRKNDNILTEEELLAFNKYAIGIISNTIKNLKNGYIECSPIDKKCDHCEFLQICKHANEKSKTRSQNYTLTNQVFLELNYE